MNHNLKRKYHIAEFSVQIVIPMLYIFPDLFHLQFFCIQKPTTLKQISSYLQSQYTIMPIPRFTYAADAAGQRNMERESSLSDVSTTGRTNRPTSPVPASEDYALDPDRNDAGSSNSMFSDPSGRVRQALLSGYWVLCDIYGDTLRLWVRDVLVASAAPPALIDVLDLVSVLFRSHNSNHITQGVQSLESLLSCQPAWGAMRLRVHPNTIPILRTFSRMLELFELTPERTLWAHLIEAHTGFYVARIAAGLSDEDTPPEPPATGPVHLTSWSSYDRADLRFAQNNTRDLPFRNRINSPPSMQGPEFASQTDEIDEITESFNAAVRAANQSLEEVIHSRQDDSALNSVPEPPHGLVNTQLSARQLESDGTLENLPRGAIISPIAVPIFLGSARDMNRGGSPSQQIDVRANGEFASGAQTLAANAGPSAQQPAEPATRDFVQEALSANSPQREILSGAWSFAMPRAPISPTIPSFFRPSTLSSLLDGPPSGLNIQGGFRVSAPRTRELRTARVTPLPPMLPPRAHTPPSVPTALPSTPVSLPTIPNTPPPAATAIQNNPRPVDSNGNPIPNPYLDSSAQLAHDRDVLENLLHFMSRNRLPRP